MSALKTVSARLTLIICVELLLQLLHLLVVSQQSLVSFQGACGLLLLLLANVSHQRVLIVVCNT